VGDREERSVSNIGWPELLIILALIGIFVFLPKRLPQLARSLGKSIRSFRKGVKEGKDGVQTTVDEVKDAAGVEDVKAAVAEIREATSVKGVLPGKKKTVETSPGAVARKKKK
jgi:sec-independent protein translocase protein TatA